MADLLLLTLIVYYIKNKFKKTYYKNELFYRITSTNSTHTFPTATAVVAMSKIKLSPFSAGAASDNGFVPNAACNKY